VVELRHSPVQIKTFYELKELHGNGRPIAATIFDNRTGEEQELPVDAVLMEVGRAATVAGKKDDASRAYTRIVEEFPQSMYSAEAKEKLTAIKKA